MSRLARTIRLALKSLLLHKLRSGLTMLGIVFGVFSVIAMMAIGEGASAQAQKQVFELGATNIIIRSIKPPTDLNASAGGDRQRILIYGLLRSDFRQMEEATDAIRRAIPIREVLQEGWYQANRMNVRLVGCPPEYMEINHLDVSRGRFLSDRDLELKANIAVISSQVADELFEYEDPIGKNIRVGRTPYRIVGIMQPREASGAVGGSMSGQDFAKDVYVPITTVWARLTDQIITIASGSFSAEQVELNQITLQVRTKEDVLKTASLVRELLEQSHPDKKDYSIIVPLELLKQADQIRKIFNVVLGSIAAISLIVGGIGIMNIMLATVTERTREIGVRRALGATQRDIVVQFLTETMVLAGTGGLVGVVMGLLTPFAWDGIQTIVDNFILTGGAGGSGAGGGNVGQMFSDLQPIVPFWSLPLSFGISVGIGVIFGLYPARSAARLDPIEALRHE